jgi:anion-transporting  ArsA/GET3 family ATPase
MEVKALKKTHFFIGTGGVGKTTLASMYALKLAKENPDAKLKLVTIDPSNRLKSFFNIQDQNNQIQVGNLLVSLNDRSALLKDFVARAAKSRNVDTEAIFSNKLFSTLMDGLAVSQEFSSLYELCISHKSGKFDYVIIDTPPLQNTSDFLKSSEVLTEFFSSTLARFFLSQDERGFFYKVANSARRTSLKVLASLTGSDFVDELAFFFKVIEFLRGDLLQVLEVSREILKSEASVYIVCNANELSLCGLRVALDNMDKDELNLEKCIINKLDSQNLNVRVQGKIDELKKNFPNLDYIKVPHFKNEPSDYKDLIESMDDVKF